MVTIGDASIGDYSKINIQEGTYTFKDNKLTFDFEEKIIFETNIKNNTIYLSNKELEIDDIEFQALDASLKDISITKECFNGSYYISNEYYNDSIDFVNDSIILYTGQYNPNFPAKKWELIYYKGFNILNIHQTLGELFIIKSCSKDKIILQSPFIKNLNLSMTPTSTTIKKSDFVGRWNEVKSLENNKPLLPGLISGEELLKLDIDLNTITSTIKKRSNKNKWEISKDGKRIYFTDKLDSFKDESFSWKIIKLTEKEMILKIVSKNGFKDENIVLVKE